MNARVVPMQEELQQTRPFESPAQEAVLGIVRTADLLKRRMAAILEPFGVSVQQYNVLRILRGAGPTGLPTLEIGDRMLEQSPGITRLIDRLVDHGWADRLRCASDRRVVYCRITEQGLALLDAADPAIRVAPEEFLSELNEAQREELVTLLDLVRAGRPVPDCDGKPAGD